LVAPGAKPAQNLTHFQSHPGGAPGLDLSIALHKIPAMGSGDLKFSAFGIKLLTFDARKRNNVLLSPYSSHLTASAGATDRAPVGS
jgi:hypothetical protein